MKEENERLKLQLQQFHYQLQSLRKQGRQKEEVNKEPAANRSCLASMPLYEGVCRRYRNTGLAGNYSEAARAAAMALEDKLKTSTWVELSSEILELPKEDRNLLSFRTHTIAVYGSGPSPS